MTIEQLFLDKTTKAKSRVGTIGEWLINGELQIDELLAYAEQQKASDKATCIEAIEYATKKDATIANAALLTYLTGTLNDDEPRIKWESAKTIGNIAKHFPTQLDGTIHNLLQNADKTGTVVRWATAYALGEILKLKTKHAKELLPKIEALCDKEVDKGVKKKYMEALKKATK